MSRGFHSNWWRGSNAERTGFATTDLSTPLFWYETDTEVMYVWNGTSWAEVAPTSDIKSGATQAAAGAIAGELWKTNGHASLPNNVVMIGV